MNADQFAGIARTLIASTSGLVAGTGVVSGSIYETIAGAVVTIIVAVWSVLSKKPAP